MDWWQIITVIVVPGVSALWVWYSTKYLPAKQAREAADAEARLEAEVDTREHRQKQENLAVAYHLSEGAAAQQVMAELVAMSQEGEREANQFVRENMAQDLAAIDNRLADLVSAIEKLTQAETQRAKLFTLQNGILSEMSQELRGQQAKISMLVELYERD